MYALFWKLGAFKRSQLFSLSALFFLLSFSFFILVESSLVSLSAGIALHDSLTTTFTTRESLFFFSSPNLPLCLFIDLLSLTPSLSSHDYPIKLLTLDECQSLKLSQDFRFSFSKHETFNARWSRFTRFLSSRGKQPRRTR